ncbi:hypothetical protein PRUPE_6G008100 [Prunus persica]|uniref:NIF system FeS cluster assembly NifU C-terminal domain-containing protein n=1 Tax=Prunus persica TaxID=3760 RepID=A0A251NIF9_PRUPE|nr:hypothetical protein PRUPE_6G008100 [Prunus persica]ONH99060.1 hypothetical protein PRUPE_6G008100 [Prunus persica]ONH99061.1 hypothetical protein PRUPE_6G008100 [Prunus persica]
MTMIGAPKTSVIVPQHQRGPQTSTGGSYQNKASGSLPEKKYTHCGGDKHTSTSCYELIGTHLLLSLSLSQFKPSLCLSQGSIFVKSVIRASNPSAATESSSPGLYSAKKYELTVPNVDVVLEDVRPYLIADGGNVDVVSVEDGVVSLKLQGACGSCPSSTTTMKMGIERVLKEKFGDGLKDISSSMTSLNPKSKSLLKAT